MDNQSITKQLVSQLAQDKLDLQHPVDVSRDWLMKEGKAYIQVLQNRQFKFHVLCEPKDDVLTATEDLVVEVLTNLGYKINRKFMN
jgi:hypothetical protein